MIRRSVVVIVMAMLMFGLAATALAKHRISPGSKAGATASRDGSRLRRNSKR